MIDEVRKRCKYYHTVHATFCDRASVRPLATSSDPEFSLASQLPSLENELWDEIEEGVSMPDMLTPTQDMILSPSAEPNQQRNRTNKKNDLALILSFLEESDARRHELERERLRIEQQKAESDSIRSKIALLELYKSLGYSQEESLEKAGLS
jgi:hypothetical protein